MFPSAWCREPLIEVMPLKSLATQIPYLPPDARVHVTHPPGRTPEVTANAAARLRRSRPDLTVVPHLAARRIGGRAHLAELIGILQDAGVGDALIVAGDATDTPAGDYAGGLPLIQDIRQLYPDFGTIAVPGYPDGHPFISDAQLVEALAGKAPWANAIVTQICFDPKLIVAWLQGLAERGIDLPVYIGVPGPLKYSRLLRIGTQIGVGASLRFLRRHGSMLAGIYSPDTFLHELAQALDAADLRVAGLHINTFNQVDASERWRKGHLTEA